MRTRNVTLAIHEDLFRQIKVLAAKQETSISAMLTHILQRIVDEEEGYGEARRGMLGDLKRGYNLGTGGKVDWTRGSAHDR